MNQISACNFALAQICLYCIVARTRKTGVYIKYMPLKFQDRVVQFLYE